MLSNIKAKLLKFRSDYRDANEQMHKTYWANRASIDILSKQKAIPDPVVHAHLKPYFEAKGKIETLKSEFKSYQENTLRQILPFPMSGL